MEAYMYRCHPQTRLLVDLVRAGDKIGQVKLIKANFSFDGRSLGPSSRLWRNELGGGAIMDIGGCKLEGEGQQRERRRVLIVFFLSPDPMSFARLIAGASQQQHFANPLEVKGVGYIQPDTKVDEYAVASLKFEHGVSAQLFTGVFADSDCGVEVVGSEGTFKVPNLWRPDLTVLGPVQIEYKSHSKSEVEIIPVTMDETNLFAIEADAVADALADEQHRECKYMTLDDTLGQVRAMDQWRKEVGLRYQEDQD
jgi:predicted dehydrogenase